MGWKWEENGGGYFFQCEPEQREHCQFCGAFMRFDEEWGRHYCGKCEEFEDDDPAGPVT